MLKRFHAIFSGRVQGVGFRFTAQAEAQHLGLCGWVRNLHTGEVEITAEGPKEDLEDFLTRLDRHFSGYIHTKEVSWETPTGEFKNFDIRF